MKISAKDTAPKLGKTPLLVVFAEERKKPELPAGVELSAIALRDFKGEFRQQRACDPTSGPAERVLLVGLGKTPDAEALRRAGALAVKFAKTQRVASAVLWASETVCGLLDSEAAVGEALTEGARMASYSYDECKSKPTPAKLTQVTLHGAGRGFAKGVRRGKALAEANLCARDLQNAPANYLTPRIFAQQAQKVARKSERISCKVLDEPAMKKLGMGSLLGVSRGSEEPARLIHLTYKPKGKARGRVAFVGKGLTFDAGGISLKPSAKMDEMRYDMSGGAAVLGTFRSLCDLDVPYEVHGIIAASENLPDGKATKPGDVHTAMDGTTIEVLNTDAEGRLILADALCYTVKKVKPETIIDLATLTGAVVMALGHELSGMFATTDKLRDELTAAGEQVAEQVWPLPLLECHREQVKGKVADLRNINSGQGNGSTAGAAFLRHFVGDTEWCHLDIAGTAWGSVDRDYVGGPTGSGVGPRLLMQYLENKKESKEGSA